MYIFENISLNYILLGFHIKICSHKKWFTLPRALIFIPEMKKK